MCDLIKHAERELKLAGLFDEDSDYNGMLAEAIMELIKVFSEQNHSGASANLVSNFFNKLSRFEQLTPLTFQDDEWNDIGNYNYQNKRQSAVFKVGKDGRPYFLDAYVKVAVFPDGHKSGWGGILRLEGHKYVNKCYIKDPAKMPTVRIEMKVHYNSKDCGDWDFEPAEKESLGELRKYYDIEISSEYIKP